MVQKSASNLPKMKAAKIIQSQQSSFTACPGHCSGQLSHQSYKAGVAIAPFPSVKKLRPGICPMSHKNAKNGTLVPICSFYRLHGCG